MTTTEQDILIRTPNVEAFKRGWSSGCRMCGTRASLVMRCSSALRAGIAVIVGARFCPGGKEPTEAKSPIAMVMSGEAEHVNSCAGVLVPHLHLRCNTCGFERLMATAESAR